MPQMMPMNWIMLYFFFCSMFLMFNFLNYFSTNYNIKFSHLSKKLINSLNWKW
uniref:ATP synthase F0 subunit 8 n=1 Tax=Rhyacophila kando TaxID=2904902 RepID=A0A9E8RSP2_9NEOP|nr:ATP synthase F0 subunit 8 [Rhyacophila kando]UZZ44354.1 ATP synthase F0 subunit 8 [Rhyacophila kando]